MESVVDGFEVQQSQIEEATKNSMESAVEMSELEQIQIEEATKNSLMPQTSGSYNEGGSSSSGVAGSSAGEGKVFHRSLNSSGLPTRGGNMPAHTCEPVVERCAVFGSAMLCWLMLRIM